MGLPIRNERIVLAKCVVSAQGEEGQWSTSQPRSTGARAGEEPLEIRTTFPICTSCALKCPGHESSHSSKRVSGTGGAAAAVLACKWAARAVAVAFSSAAGGARLGATD